jgi:hypothetical protein
MRALIMTLLAAGTLGCTDTPKGDGEKGPKGKVWAGVTVNLPVVDANEIMRRDDPFMISFGVVNDTDKVINPHIDKSKLIINGQELKEWTFIVGNGPRDDRWEALLPGDNIRFGYGFGGQLGRHFRQPGLYRVKWIGEQFESAEIQFRVVPPAKN